MGAESLDPYIDHSDVRADPTEETRELCRSEGKAWSLRDFENGVPGVTMLTVVADENKRREYLNRAKVMLKRNST